VPSYVNKAARAIPQRIFNLWRKSVKGEWYKPDVLLVNGDAIDGGAKRDSGVYLWTQKITDQIQCAAELISMWGAKKTYITRGTDYHVSVDDGRVHAEEILAQELGAEFWPNQENVPEKLRERSGYDITLSAEGANFHYSHHLPVSSSPFYLTTPLAKDMVHAALHDPVAAYGKAVASGLAAEMGGIGNKVNAVIRAHGHKYMKIDFARSAGVCLPSWQARPVYMQKKKPLAIPADIGFVGIEVRGGKIRYEKNLWTVAQVQIPPIAIC